MEIKKIDDSKVDEIIKESDKAALSHREEHSAGKETDGGKNKKGILGAALIFLLLALSIVQSVELMNLRKQIQSGQFGAAAAPATGGNPGLPSQQGGC